jgi:nitric oxide reductase activation protein
MRPSRLVTSRFTVTALWRTLDPHAGAYVKRIFGENNYTIIDNVDRLPENLPQFFASLTS